MESVEVDGLRIAYQRAGTGPPLVLLHGYVGDGPTFWRPQLDALGDEFTVIAWDAPAPAGRPTRRPPSAWPATPIAWPASSSGSAWADPTWPACPSAAPLPSPSPAATRGSRGPWSWPPPTPAGPAPSLPRRPPGASTRPRSWPTCPPPSSWPPSSRRCSRPRPHPGSWRRSAPACALSTPLASAPWPPPRPRTSATPSPRISVPTLLLYGAGDVRAPLPVAEDLHRAIPGSTLVVLPDAGHVCNLEAPEAFNRAVRSFLSNPDRVGPSA